MSQILHHKEPLQLEAGGILPEITIAYDTFGTLNEDGSNAIWVCHALTANSDVADWWPNTVVEGRFLDPNKYFIICANTLGSCYGTTGPTSINPETGKPYYGDFPLITVRDIIKVHQILARHLGIKSVYAMIGSSLGGFQALEWTLMDPSFVQRLLLIATGSHCQPWLAAFNKSMYMAIECDPTWGEYNENAGMQGLACARSIALISYRGWHAYNRTQWDQSEDGKPLFKRRAHSYQAYQGEKLCRRFNPYSYYRLCQSVDSHDVSRGRGTMEEVLGSLNMPVLVVAISSDLLFPECDHREMADRFKNCTYKIIDSDFAHDGFLIENEKLDKIIQDFFRATTPEGE